MIFRLTKEIKKKLKVDNLDSTIYRNDQFDEWFVSLFACGLKKYIITTNAKCLYSVISDSKGLTRFDIYINRFIDDLFIQIKKDGFFEFFDAVEKSINEVRIGKTNNRSILGSMNDFIFQAKYYLENETISDASRHINESPMSYLGMKNPNSVLAENYKKEKKEES